MCVCTKFRGVPEKHKTIWTPTKEVSSAPTIYWGKLELSYHHVTKYLHPDGFIGNLSNLVGLRVHISHGSCVFFTPPILFDDAEVEIPRPPGTQIVSEARVFIVRYIIHSSLYLSIGSRYV